MVAAALVHLAVAVVPAVASEPVRLTPDGARKMAPAFIEGGAAIAYAAHERPNLVALVQVSCRDGSRRERVLPSVVNHQFDPAFTTDGRYLAYSRTATSPQSAQRLTYPIRPKPTVLRGGPRRRLGSQPGRPPKVPSRDSCPA